MPSGRVFLTLPTEVRLQVYRYLFEGQSVCASAVHFPNPEAQTDNSKHVPTARKPRVTLQPLSQVLNITFTCKQLHREALPAFYSYATFVFRRRCIDELIWTVDELRDCFPSYSPWQSTFGDIDHQQSIRLVRRVFYAGNDPALIRNVAHVFPALTSFEFDLDWDHAPGDQTNFNYAIKYLKRHREWRNAIRDAVDQRFPSGMTRALFDLQKQGPARGFPVTLQWRIGWRFLEFAGTCDLDEWVLGLYNADLIGQSGSLEKHYFKQDPIYHEMD